MNTTKIRILKEKSCWKTTDDKCGALSVLFGEGGCPVVCPAGPEATGFIHFPPQI
jgi:hypothetical protein